MVKSIFFALGVLSLLSQNIDATNTKIFFGLGSPIKEDGYRDLPTNKTGYVDIETGETKMCNEYPGVAFHNVAYGVAQDQYPILCSGESYENQACYQLNSGNWVQIQSKNLNQQQRSACVSVPEVGLWVIGGCCSNPGTLSDSTEILGQDLIWKMGPRIPGGGRTGHCAVQMSGSETFVYGGLRIGHEYYHHGQIFDWLSQKWTITHRSSFSSKSGTRCGFHGASKNVVIINSDDGTVQLYDQYAKKFRVGPNLPYTNKGGSLIQVDDRLFLVGGEEYPGGPTKKIFEFDEDIWKKMDNVQLPYYLENFSAFSINDVVAQNINCN